MESGRDSICGPNGGRRTGDYGKRLSHNPISSRCREDCSPGKTVEPGQKKSNRGKRPKIAPLSYPNFGFLVHGLVIDVELISRALIDN